MFIAICVKDDAQYWVHYAFCCEKHSNGFFERVTDNFKFQNHTINKKAENLRCTEKK